VSTNANGKYLLPTHLDPTIILTSALSTNEVRKIARVVTLTDGAGGVERHHVGRRHGVVGRRGRGGLRRQPDLRQPVDPDRPGAGARAGVISAVEDIADLGNDVMMMFADAKDRLEGAAHATGAGTTTPKGVFTAVARGLRLEGHLTTAATIGLADLNAVYVNPEALPRQLHVAREPALHGGDQGARHRGLGVVLRRPARADRPRVASWVTTVVESDDAPTTQTTTALDLRGPARGLLQFVIVDRPGGMSVEYIPHLFNTANNLPDGRRAWYATWRNGSDVTNADAFRLLVDKTSA
jgi:hypothetical protein